MTTSSQPTVPDHGCCLPGLGDPVIYRSRNGDGIESPAVVLRTRASTNLTVLERWPENADGTLSGVGRPAGLVVELPDETTVDLLVHGLGGDYREYAVPAGSGPRTWRWPDRPAAGCSAGR